MVVQVRAAVGLSVSSASLFEADRLRGSLPSLLSSEEQ